MSFITYTTENGHKWGEFTEDAKIWRHHYVAIYDWTTMKLFIDNVQDATTYTQNWNIRTNSNTNLVIWAEYNKTNNQDGKIDDVRIYNYALTTWQINQLYNTTITKYSTWLRWLNATQIWLNEWTYTYQACAEDFDWLTGCTNTQTYTVDTISPFIEHLSPENGTGIYPDTTIDILRSGNDWSWIWISGYNYQIYRWENSVWEDLASGHTNNTGLTINGLLLPKGDNVCPFLFRPRQKQRVCCI